MTTVFAGPTTAKMGHIKVLEILRWIMILTHYLASPTSASAVAVMLKTEKANNETEEEEEEDKDDSGVEEECRGKQKEVIVKRNQSYRND
jgi:H+/gluconate symporter-like permease